MSLTERLLRRVREALHDDVVTVLTGLAGVVVGAALLRDLSLVFVRVPLSANEGWNAYHAAAAFGPALYPNPPAMMYNNYPPLSFVLVGAFGRWIGGDIAAGRLLALASTAACAVFIAGMARRMGCAKAEALLASLMFLASPWMLSDYAMFDDPQMLGQALGCAGFLIVLRGRDVVFAALLFTLALFVKPLFLAQPFAAFIWLWRENPRSARHLALWGLVFALIGLAATRLTYGTMLFGHLASARVYEWTRTLGHPGTWLLTEGAPLAATLALFRFPEDRHARLCALYAAVAVALGVFFSGGQGLGGNAMFDASIATALGAAVLISRLRWGATAPSWLGSRPRAKIALACAAPMTIVLAVSITDVKPAVLSLIRPHAQDITAAESDVAFIGAHQGPAFCEALAFCYWAHKNAEIDAFNLPQAFKTGARSMSDLIRLLDARYFTSMQLDRRSAFAYSDVLRCAFARNYRVDHADPFGLFLLPLAKPATNCGRMEVLPRFPR